MSNVLVGNPNLKPQDTDSYEISYEHREGSAFSLLTAYYRDTRNGFSATFTDLGNGVLQQTRAKIGRQTNLGIEWNKSGKLSPKLTYGFSIDAYYTEIDAPGFGALLLTSATTGFGRANLNWQVTPKDFLQINLYATGKQLLGQGYVAPSFTSNIGYRRTINSKVSWMLTVQDPFESSITKLVTAGPTGAEIRRQKTNGRSFGLSLVWNFAGTARDTGFDFGGGSPAAP